MNKTQLNGHDAYILSSLEDLFLVPGDVHQSLFEDLMNAFEDIAPAAHKGSMLSKLLPVDFPIPGSNIAWVNDPNGDYSTRINFILDTTTDGGTTHAHAMPLYVAIGMGSSVRDSEPNIEEQLLGIVESMLKGEPSPQAELHNVDRAVDNFIEQISAKLVQGDVRKDH